MGKGGTVQQVGARRVALSLHVDSSMQVADRFVPPARWFPPWREAKKRWHNMTQSYMFANRIALALADQRRLALGAAPKRILALKRTVALSAQLMLPRFGFSRRSFARGPAAELYLRLLDAHVRADAAQIKAVASDSYARTLISELKARQKAVALPAGAALRFQGDVQKAKAVNVRVVMNQQPQVEFAQVLVLFRLALTVDVVAADGDGERRLSRQQRVVEDVVAFERNLLDAKAGWRVLDKLRSQVLSDKSEAPDVSP